MIKCRKCFSEKDRNEFHVRTKAASGRHPHCKECVKKYKADYLSRPESKALADAYRRSAQAKARRACYKKSPPTEEQLNSRREKRKTPEALAQRNEYLSQPHVRARTLELRKARYHEKGKHDVSSVISGRMRVLIRRSMKTGKNNRSWRDFVDFSIEELKAHLERQFTRGMSWALLLSGDIEIDHIIPISSFQITSEECAEFNACWRLANLRPMWRKENNAKRAKIIYLV